jgi:hypothetical protein
MATIDFGKRLYHHSCNSGVKRIEKSVNNVAVGREPGWKQLNGIRGATPGSQIWHKPAPNPSPTRLLAAPSQATTGPGELFTIKQTATGANHPKAVLTAWTGMDRSMFQQCLNIRMQSRNRCHRDDQLRRAVVTLKSHPPGWQNDRPDGATSAHG